VGCSYDYPDLLSNLDQKRLADVTIINTLPVTLLSAYVLKEMANRKNGIVINISSSAGYRPVYGWGVYSASKVI
jgi:short-subunit dehydrogenase